MMTETIRCPAMFIAAPASGQGKTTVTAALARLHARQGRRVRVFKCGPDFLDPQIHAVASGAAVYNLDFGMCGKEDAAWRLARAAKEADLLLIEGVMGLYDGEPCGADIACRFDVPVLAVIDAHAMAQTFAAVAHGLATFRRELRFAGVLANHVAGDGHARLLRQALPAEIGWFGALGREHAATLPERHLGLLQAREIGDLTQRLDLLADELERTRIADLPAAVAFPFLAEPPVAPRLDGRTIAVAKDAAYNFIYPANVDLLQKLGAEIRYFSPLAGDGLPRCDALWLPGGYPELHAAALTGNRAFMRQLREHVMAARPLLAECGGMMTLFEEMIDQQGVSHRFAGALPGSVRMQPRLAALGVQKVLLPEGELNGHTFHYSRSDTPLEPLVHARRQDGGQGEAVYRQARLTASYVHFYFPSNPQAAAALFLEEKRN